MRVRSEGVQMRALGREIGALALLTESSPQRRTSQYVEEPDPEISRQSAEMRGRSRTFMNIPG